MKCKLKLLWDSVSLEWLLRRMWQAANVGKNVEKEKSLSTAGRNVKLYSHCKNQYGSNSEN